MGDKGRRGAAWSAGLLGLGALLACSAASATTVIKMDVGRLSAEADVVALGRVEATSSRWEGGRIITDVTLRVVVPIKGQPSAEETVVVRRLGGEVGELRQVVAGATDFAKGEQVLIFLDEVETPQAHHLAVMGMAQGKWTLAEGSGGRLFGVRDLSELSLAEVEERADGTREVVRIEEGSAVREGAVSLDALLGQVVDGMRQAGQEGALRPEVLRRLSDGGVTPFDFRADFQATEVLR